MEARARFKERDVSSSDEDDVSRTFTVSADIHAPSYKTNLKISKISKRFANNLILENQNCNKKYKRIILNPKRQNENLNNNNIEVNAITKVISKENLKQNSCKILASQKFNFKETDYIKPPPKNTILIETKQLNKADPPNNNENKKKIMPTEHSLSKRANTTHLKDEGSKKKKLVTKDQNNVEKKIPANQSLSKRRNATIKPLNIKVGGTRKQAKLDVEDQVRNTNLPQSHKSFFELAEAYRARGFTPTKMVKRLRKKKPQKSDSNSSSSEDENRNRTRKPARGKFAKNMIDKTVSSNSELFESRFDYFNEPVTYELVIEKERFGKYKRPEDYSPLF